MSEYRGYTGKSLSFLQDSKVKVGDSVKVVGDLTYSGIVMPRYEHTDDEHIVLKLKSGYNIGLEIKKIKNIELLSSEKIEPKSSEKVTSDSALPKVLLLSTGGTIASKIDYRTGAVTPALSAEDLNSAVPELSKLANIEAEVLFSEYSENLQPEHWEQIAKKLDSISNSDYRGIIIAHGTDTMQYSASFLSFALSGFPIPVALVGSQRSSDRPSSDAAQNLISAVRFVLESKTAGFFVVMHHNDEDDLVVAHLGTRVRKNHTSKRSAFQTVGEDPAFLILENKIQKNLDKDYFSQKEYTPKIKLDSRVALVKYYPGYDPKIIKFLIDSGFKAIIFEGTGLGHVGKNLYDSVKQAHESGLFMGMTSQCIDGRVGMNVYESGRDLQEFGIVPLSNLLPETALVKAMWALGNSKDIAEMKDLMIQNIASEISD